MAILSPELGAGSGKGCGEATAVVGQHVSEAEGERGCSFAEKGNGAFLVFIVLDREVDGAGPAVDGHEQVPLAPLPIGLLQLGQLLDVDVDEAEVVTLEGFLSLGGAVGNDPGPVAELFGAGCARCCPG